MELTLTCKECGHEERGESTRALIAKIRMWNHLNREHPELAESFRSTVAEETSQPAAPR